MHNQPHQPLDELARLREENEQLRATVNFLRATINYTAQSLDTEAICQLTRDSITPFCSSLRKMASEDYQFSKEDLSLLGAATIIESNDILFLEPDPTLE